MNTLHWLVRVLVTAVVLLALLVSTRTAMAQGGIVEDSVESEPFGTFDGISYVKYSGEYEGTSDAEYSVPFEIVAPEDPAQGNGALYLEPLHILGGTFGRDAYITPEFLFGQGFSYAGIGWHPPDVNPMEGYPIEDAVDILQNFANALREDDVFRGWVGDLQQLYSFGVSNTTEPLLELMDAADTSPFGFTFLIVPEWRDEVYTQPAGSNNVIVFLTESDLVLSAVGSLHTEAFRGSSPTYREYEVAGGPHVPDVPLVREIGPMLGATSEGTTPLDWSPVTRALLVAGHRWATEGIEPPPSVSFTEAPKGDIDAVYESQYGLELETGLARDENGNTLGGIRLPDLEVGRGQYIAVDPESFFGSGLFGAFIELKCERLADGSARFEDHTLYVSEFTQQAQTLVEQGFLLQEDADSWVAAATASNVGDAAACPPTSLPESGQAMKDGLPILLLALAGLILIAAGLVLHQRVHASR